MKKITTLMAMGLLLITWKANAQTVAVPETVKKSFEMNYSAVKQANWEKQEIIVYKATYVENGITYETFYTSEGQWLRTYNAIKETDLPVQITNQVTSIYKTFQIAKTGMELNNEGKFYLIHLENGKD
ncbi:MAG TPA: hypothetical protein VK202_01035, partial [Bacteroidia bacterium]|nr:hypothetical protein [Bacteroidia bacterium]